MNYLTNYYKNLSEQLQEKVNYLTKLLEQEANPLFKNKKLNATEPYPGYDYEEGSQSMGWERQDISPAAWSQATKEITKNIGVGDVDPATGKARASYKKQEVGPYAEYDPENAPREYSMRQDMPSATDVVSGMANIRAQQIALANKRALASAEMISGKGNKDVLSMAMQRAGEEGDVDAAVMRKAKEAEARIRQQKGKSVR